MKTLAATITLAGLTILGLSACAQPATVPGTPAAPATSAPAAPSPVTIVVPPPSTVYQAPPQTVTVPAPPKATLTSCQSFYANGYSYAAVLSLWAQQNFPANWDADHDGYPCEQTYGNKN
jgi:hypothetical protein